MAKSTHHTLATVRRLFLEFPDVEEGPCYGTPGFRVRGRFLARIREDDVTLAVKCGHEESDAWRRAKPESFFITEHYRGSPAVLVNLATVALADLRAVLEQAWRRSAPKRLLAAYDSQRMQTEVGMHVGPRTMSKSPNTDFADKLALYEALVATNPSVERKGDSMPYTSLNGNMFSFMAKSGRVALRLPSGARDAFLKKHKDSVCVQHGIVMKEYVELPDAMLAKKSEAKKWFDASFEYARSLKPKPTTKKKAPAKKA